MASQIRALVLLAEGAEEMEVVIPVDVLRRASIDVVLAGIDGGGVVACSRGVRLVPDRPLLEVLAELDAGASFDVVLLPGGGPGSERLAANSEVGALVRRQLGAGGVVAAICAAPRALVAHGVGQGRAMTSHPSVRPVVEPWCGAGGYREQDVVQDGPFVTSRGPGTAFAFALALVRRLRGDAAADEVAAPMMLP